MNDGFPQGFPKPNKPRPHDGFPHVHPIPFSVQAR